MPSALLVAVVSMLGSLYYSEVAGYVPCELCWYQRYLMYPLVPIALVLLWRQVRLAPLYLLPLALVGLGVATYHVLVQNGVFSQPGTCAMGVPCSSRYVDYLGFITIPVLAMTAFALISAVSLALLAVGDGAEEWEAEGLASEAWSGDRPVLQRLSGFGASAVLVFAAALLSWTAVVGNVDDSGLDELTTGEELFAALVLDESPGCAVCHSIEPGIVMVGPTMSGLREVAADRVPGLSAEAYLRQAIVDPDAHLVDGHAAGIMYAGYGDVLDDEQIELLVEYLLTLP